MRTALSLSDYPNMDPRDAGMLPNIGYGTVEGVRAHCIAGGATALLSSDVAASEGSFDVQDASRFPSPPFTVQVSYERMLVTSVDGSTFTVARGYEGTKAEPHRKNKTVFEVRTEYVYLVSDEPVKAVNGVYVDGRGQAQGFAAYTGRSGDEHQDWPGKAVVAFQAEAHLGRQRNLDTADARDRESGESLEATVETASDDRLADGSDSSHVDISLAGWPSASVAFAQGQGAVKRQTYWATVENAALTEEEVRAVVMDTESGAAVLNRLVHVPASTKTTVALEQKGGSWRTVFALLPFNADIKVYAMGKTVLRERLPGEDDALVAFRCPPLAVSDGRLADGTSSSVAIDAQGRLMAWAAYDASALGEASSQVHFAEVENPSGTEEAVVRLVSADPSGAGRKATRHTLAPGGTAVLSHAHDGGAWDTMTKVLAEKGEVMVAGLYKDVLYYTEDTLSERALAATASARAVIGDDITVDADWAEDATGDYGGQGTLIERPDRVIRHFIVERMGLDPEDVDAASFDSAGDLYDSAVPGGYRFAFVMDGEATPSELLGRLAFECRSTVGYDRGKWRLNYVPDQAPPASRAIGREELAGDLAGVEFSKMPLAEVANDLTARFRRDYWPGGSKSGWLGVSRASDGASMAKYGRYAATLEFLAIREQAMAEHVLAHILLERKAPLLRVSFPVFYGHFDLRAGDTIEIDNPLYGGRKFYIEEIRRLDRFRAEVRGVEWW